MSRALIAIGLSSAPGMPKLPGAVPDAKKMREWAVSQKYEHIHLFTDENNSKVGREQIHDLLDDLVAMGDITNIIVYFSGHGYAPYPGIEFWLLSDWMEDGSEAIHVPMNTVYARGYDWPRLSFIGDACRSTFKTNAPPIGGAIVPRPGSDQAESRVDEFYPTQFGFPTIETDDEKIQNSVVSFGVFTREVIKGLGGAAATEVRGGKRVVTSDTLRTYLLEAVPSASSKIPRAAVLRPQLNAQWTPVENVYAQFDDGAADPRERGIEAMGIDLVAPPPRVRSDRKQQEDVIEADKQRFMAAQGRRSFETRIGASIIGAEARAVVSDVETNLFEEGGAWHVRVHAREPTVIYVALSKPAWEEERHLAIAAYPDLLATAVIDDDGCWSLNYEPAPGGAYEHAPQDSAGAQAEATAYLRNGAFPEKDRLDKIVETLRVEKFYNPALAVLAANVCHKMGDLKTLRDMTQFPVGIGNFAPYDWAVLAGLDRATSMGRTIVGSFPLMSYTWAVLAAADFELPGEMIAAQRTLLPSLWTMTTAEGVEMLRSIPALAFAHA